MMAINPKTPFPDSLKLETITKFYHESILHRQKTSTIWNRTRQSNSKYNKHHTQRQTMQRIPGICECCGISGHDIRTTGYDFAASFILTNDFLRKNSNMKKQVLSKFKSYQKN